MTFNNIQTAGQRIADRANAIARERGVDVQQFLSLVAREQLVSAIFRVDEGRCALKGGTVALLDDNVLPFARPSRDLDLELGACDLNELLDILELASADARRHGIIFEWSNPEMSVHDGAQVRVVARFGKSVANFHLDVEFGTQRVPGMHTRRVPSIVPGLPDLVVNAFPREAAIADKLHAIYRHGPVNTRMGDYYDLFQMAGDPIRDDVLDLCLKRAFGRFGHRMPQDWGEMTGLSDQFVRDRSSMWLKMLDRYGLREWAPSEFDDVVDRIRKLAARAFGEAPELDATIPMRAGFAYRPTI